MGERRNNPTSSIKEVNWIIRDKMINAINEEILKLKEKLREHGKVETLAREIETELRNKKVLRQSLKQTLSKEGNDLERLEKNTINSIFLNLVGKREERIELEKEELHLARLKYEECEDQIIQLEKDKKEANSLLLEYHKMNKDLARLIKEKEEILIKEGGEDGLNLKNKLVKIDELKVDIKEVKEAINASKDAIDSLNRVGDSLRSAKNWGTWDLLGGGLIANIGKHSALDKANQMAREVQFKLRTLRKELQDVNEFTDIQVELSGFATFADFFLDGIIADWFVQSKINTANKNVDTAVSRIQMIMADLNRNLIHLEHQLKDLEYGVKDILDK